MISKVATGVVAALALVGAIYAGFRELAFSDDIKRIEHDHEQRMDHMLTVMQHQSAVSKSIQDIMTQDAIDRAIANPDRTTEQTARLKQLIELGE